jgi:hypothetical protein
LTGRGVFGSSFLYIIEPDITHIGNAHDDSRDNYSDQGITPTQAIKYSNFQEPVPPEIIRMGNEEKCPQIKD